MAKKNKKKPLPEKLYSFWKPDARSDDGVVLNTSENPSYLVDMDETIEVGIYKLVGTTTITNKTTVGPPK